MAKKNRKLVQLSAFWKNNEPGGIGLTITQEFGDLDFIIKELMSNYDQMYAEAVRNGSVEILCQDLLRQLEQFGARKVGNMSMETAFLTIGNIYLLEKLKRIPTDEFNGLWLAYSHHKATLH